MDDLEAWLRGPAPTRPVAPALRALWWARNGDWTQAHRLVQDDPCPMAAWVHAYLHRVEDDAGNAAYWYHRAGRSVATASLDVEWCQIARELRADDPGTRSGTRPTD